MQNLRIRKSWSCVHSLRRKKTLNFISEVLFDKEKLVELIWIVRGLLQLDESRQSTVLDIENLSRNMLFSSSEAQ